MNFKREPWRKLYLRESLQQRGWSVTTRGLRDYLIRLASDDGTLIGRTKDPHHDLSLALGVHRGEHQAIADAITTLLDDGYLRYERGRLFIQRFEEAQHRDKSTNRVREHRERKRAKTDDTETVSQRFETLDANVTKPPDETDPIRSDPKRSEMVARARAKPPNPDPADLSGMDPRAEAVSDELRRDDHLRRTITDPDQTAEQLLGVAPLGAEASWLVGAIRQARAELGTDSSSHEVRRKLRVFVKNARPPKVNDHGAASEAAHEQLKAAERKRFAKAERRRQREAEANAASPEQAAAAAEGILTSLGGKP